MVTRFPKEYDTQKIFQLKFPIIFQLRFLSKQSNHLMSNDFLIKILWNQIKKTVIINSKVTNIIHLFNFDYALIISNQDNPIEEIESQHIGKWYNVLSF